MNKVMLKFVSVFLFCVATIYGSEVSPVGKWKTVDDETGRVKSIVIIWKDTAGKLHGKVEKTFPLPGEDVDPVCDKCEGSRKDKKVIGMEILWGMTPAEPGNMLEWENGKILDPKNGKIYSCLMTVTNGGNSLEVRGFIGFSLIGRSQTWQRVSE